jgi:cell division septation protein DedD
MNRKTGWGAAGAIILIILLVGLYYLLGGGPGTMGPSRVTGPAATAPATPGAPAVKPAVPPEPGPVLPAEPAGPPKELAPGGEPKVTVLPPQAGQEKFGILAGTFKKYRDAARLLAKVKKEGQPAFVQRDPRNIKRFQVWLGPFGSQSEAEEAAKTLKNILKKPAKIEAIENPVPK